jgi:Tfp pilus assembly protein PilF
VLDDHDPSAPPAAPSPSEVAIRKASHFLEVKRFDLAELELKSVLRDSPDLCHAHVLMAISLSQLDRTEEAKHAIETALALEPSSSFVLQVYGQILMDLGQNTKAEATLIAALRLNPMDPDGYRIYGTLMHKTGHLDKADRLIQKALELDPDSATLHNIISVIQAEGKKRSSSRASSHRGMTLEPESAYSHFVRGRTLLQNFKPFQARAAMREALRIEPGNTDYVESFLLADRCCRVVYLPQLLLSLVVARIPGGFIGLWITYIVTSRALLHFEVNAYLTAFVVYGYLALVLYSWVADPIVDLWIKFRPAKF